MEVWENRRNNLLNRKCKWLNFWICGRMEGTKTMLEFMEEQ